MLIDFANKNISKLIRQKCTRYNEQFKKGEKIEAFQKNIMMISYKKKSG
jgi:hypothetical protein